jgi:hypothetical protein
MDTIVHGGSSSGTETKGQVAIKPNKVFTIDVVDV